MLVLCDVWDIFISFFTHCDCMFFNVLHLLRNKTIIIAKMISEQVPTEICLLYLPEIAGANGEFSF